MQNSNPLAANINHSRRSAWVDAHEETPVVHSSASFRNLLIGVVVLTFLTPVVYILGVKHGASSKPESPARPEFRMPDRPAIDYSLEYRQLPVCAPVDHTERIAL